MTAVMIHHLTHARYHHNANKNKNNTDHQNSTSQPTTTTTTTTSTTSTTTVIKEGEKQPLVHQPIPSESPSHEHKIEVQMRLPTEVEAMESLNKHDYIASIFVVFSWLLLVAFSLYCTEIIMHRADLNTGENAIGWIAFVSVCTALFSCCISVGSSSKGCTFENMRGCMNACCCLCCVPFFELFKVVRWTWTHLIRLGCPQYKKCYECCYQTIT
jgi:hypothetical protein